MNILDCRGREALLRVRRKDWVSLVRELGRRGGGEREAGAFLLANQDGDHRTVSKIVYLDDLDPQCLQGDIHFDGRAYSKLWDLCEDENILVIGDVHTHGGRSVGQSSVDASNPMIARDGHVALIVPYLAKKVVSPGEVGVHRYQGTRGWTSWTGADAAARLYVRRWL